MEVHGAELLAAQGLFFFAEPSAGGVFLPRDGIDYAGKEGEAAKGAQPRDQSGLKIKTVLPN